MREYAFFRMSDDAAYRQWIKEFDVRSAPALERLKQRAETAAASLSICIVPICDPQRNAVQLGRFREMLNSQILAEWTCLPAVADVGEILRRARGFDCILPLPVDVRLDPTALAELILALETACAADVAYGDEDAVRDGLRTSPQFKPDWDPYFLLGRNYVGVPALYRSAALVRGTAPVVASRRTDVTLYALVLHAGADDRVVHVPRVLCHRLSPSDWDREEAAAVLRAHLVARGGALAEISPAPLAPKFNRVRFRLPDPAPLVSIIVPTKDRPEFIGPCVRGVLAETDYPSIELLIVDNGTTNPEALKIIEAAGADPRVHVLRDGRPFNFSRLNNDAARAARGDILVLLNNDTKVLHADWLTEMASLACLPDVGAVGARLLYADLRVQHAGICFDGGPAPYHQMRLAPPDEAGPCGELALLRSAWAVTGACLAIRRELYFEVGGLDEEKFHVAFNDVDLCLKAARKGLRIVCSPYARLFHFESVSRGFPMTPTQCAREETELATLWSKHRDLYGIADPYVNPQVEHHDGFVDFARPPRPHPFRFEIDWLPMKRVDY